MCVRKVFTTTVWRNSLMSFERGSYLMKAFLKTIAVLTKGFFDFYLVGENLFFIFHLNIKKTGEFLPKMHYLHVHMRLSCEFFVFSRFYIKKFVKIKKVYNFFKVNNFQFVPLIVQLCVKVVEHHGLTTVGVYRIPGNTAAVNSLTSSLDKGFENVWKVFNVKFFCISKI